MKKCNDDIFRQLKRKDHIELVADIVLLATMIAAIIAICKK